MTSPLPASVETYLSDAGFSATDILVLRRLVEGSALTLRELAVRTGRSTGVLDQSLKKLLHRRIVEKTVHNGHPSYQLSSLRSLVEWLRGETKNHQEHMERRQKDFELFVQSLSVQRHQPDIATYDDHRGIERAYGDLLSAAGKEEWLTFAARLDAPEDDPYREVLVEIFRKRQVRSVFQRVLGADAPAARRYRSRDPFEFRKTLLIPPTEMALALEITIAGDMVLCVDREAARGCLVRYPAFAKAQRAIFELLWARQCAREREAGSAEPPVTIEHTHTSAHTRVASQARNFLLSRTSLACLLACGVFSGVLSMYLLSQSRTLNAANLRSTLTSVVSDAREKIGTADIGDAVRDPTSQEYARLVAMLQLVRRSHPAIQRVALVERAGGTDGYTLIAGVHASDLDVLLLDDSRESAVVPPAPPPQFSAWYDASSASSFARAFDDAEPFVALHPENGNFMAFAPVRHTAGDAWAVLGVEADDEVIHQPTMIVLAPIAFFIVVAILYGVLCLFAHNQSLLRLCLAAMRRRTLLTILWALFLLCVAVVIVMGVRWYQRQQMIAAVGTRLMTIAANAVSEFDPADLEQLHWARDMKSEAYQRVFRKLNEIRNRNPGVTFAYIFRPTDDPHLLTFIADADSNYYLPQFSPYSLDDDTQESDAFENVWPGYVYYDHRGIFISQVGLLKPYFEYVPQEQWGEIVAGLAPIIYRNTIIGLLGVDILL